MSPSKVATFALLAATALACESASAADQHHGKLLVLEKGTEMLVVIDPQTLKVISRVPAGSDPHEVVASPDGKRAYITNYGGDGSDMHILSVVDLETNKALPAIDLGGLRSTHGIDFADGKVYFTAESSKSIGRFDPATNKVDWVLGIGQDRTHMIIVGKDPTHLYTSNVDSGTISLISTYKARQAQYGPGGLRGQDIERTLWNVTSIPSGQGPEGFDVSPDGKQLWAANTRDKTVTVIDIASKKAVQTFPVPLPMANRLKFTLDGKAVLISGLDKSTNLIVLDASTHAVLKQLNLGGGAAGLLMDPEDHSRAFVGVSFANKVSVVSLKTFSVTGEVPLAAPDGLAWVR